MKVPISWLKDFVEISIPLEELAHQLTMAGLEVEEIRYVGLPMPPDEVKSPVSPCSKPQTKITGIEWDPEKIVVGERYRKSGVSEGLLEEFFNRMRDKGVNIVTVGFLSPQFFYRFGFKIDERYGNLVKILKPEPDAITQPSLETI